jgi:hypothetical protein
MSRLAAIYARVPQFARAAPLAVPIVFIAELIQHVVEIRLGMYADFGYLDPADQRVRLMFGAVKVVAIFLVLVFALRWWRFEGDSRRAARPTRATFKGLIIVFIVQIGGELLFIGAGSLAARLIMPSSMTAYLAWRIGPALLWLMIAILLYPWYVALLTEDRGMTLRRSIRGIGWGWPRAFGLFLGGIVPAMALHYLLGNGAMGRPVPLVWALMILDAALVAALALLIASTYFSLYQFAAERS